MSLPRIALVTGGSRGIGAAICRQLAATGAHIWINYVENEEAARRVASDIVAQGGSAETVRFDVANREATALFFEERFSKGESVTWLVNNASITRDKPFFFMDDESWDDVIQTNLNSFYYVTHPVVSQMKREKIKGRIVTISSYSGVVGNRGQANYAATKAAQIAASKSLAREVGRAGIAVNVVAPGFIETGLTTEISPDMIRNVVPMRRMGKVEEVANLVCYLCAEAPPYLIGQVIGIDGGLPS